VGMLARFRAALRRRAEPPQPTQTGPYREPAAETIELQLEEFEAVLAGQHRRIRALERQLLERSEEPALTPTGAELLAIVDVLEALASGQGLHRWNTVELRHLAEAARGLERYS
jgi:hypothetical protein